MKKTILLVAAMVIATMSFHAQAQNLFNASPLNVKLTEFSLDSLRAQNPDPNKLKEELLLLEGLLKQDAQQLAQAKQQLKDELALYKTAAAMVKGYAKSMDNTDKLHQAELKEFASARKTLDSHLANVKKAANVATETRFGVEEFLKAQIEGMSYGKESLEARMTMLKDMRKSLNDLNADVVAYDTALKQKANDLKLLEERQKSHVSAIKTELKNVTAQIKGK